MAAVRSGDPEVVRRILTDEPEARSLVNEPLFPFGSYAVFECRENLAMVDVLVEHGADLNLKSDWWAGGFGILEGVDRAVARPLIERGAVVDIWAASGLDDRERATALLDRNPDLVRARGGDGKLPLHYAASTDMVDLLVGRGADVDTRDVDHESTAAQHLVNNESVVRRLLDHGALPDIYLAAALGDLALAVKCVQHDPKCTDARLGAGAWSNRAGGHIYNWTLGHDLTPQDVAREKEHKEVLQFLLEHSSPARRLAHAIWHGDQDVVYSLVRSDPGVTGQVMRQDPALMARAAWWYRPDAVRLLLELGFDPHETGVHNSTPLDRAAFHGYADIIEALIEGDPDPPVAYRNAFGGTPLGACIHGAVHGWSTGHPQNHVESARLLIEAGCGFSSTWLPTGNEALDRLLTRYLSE